MENTHQSTLPRCFNRVVSHPKIQNLLDQLKTTVTCNYGPKIVFVTGPTGVGKTTLLREFQIYLKQLFDEDEYSDPQQSVPYGYCSVKTRGTNAFSWRDTYLQLLYSLGHPFTSELEKSKRTKPWERLETPLDLVPLSSSHTQRITNDRLFRTFEKTTRYRKPKAIILDEAHHLIQAGSATSALDQLEQLKYAADETGTTHYLFGTYALLAANDLNAQLVRRRQLIEFPRYSIDADNTDDWFAGFTEAVEQFNIDLEQHCAIDIEEIIEELYVGSLGCVGILRDWLFRAYSAASESKGRRRITKNILKSTVMNAVDRITLLQEIEEGEKFFARRGNKEKELRKKLGLFSIQASDNLESPAASIPEKRPNKKGKRRVGARKAHNDKVGIHNALGVKKKGAN